MTDEYFENYRSFTRLDDLSSAIGTVKFGEKTNQWLADQKEEDEDLQKQMQEIHAMQRQLQKQDWQEGTGNGSQLSEEDITEAMANLMRNCNRCFKINSHSFSQALAQAMQETKQVKDSLKSLLGGTVLGVVMQN